ncbi:hypothetical protein IWX90DRAFT_434337 [Phyllosticta citrichinensis]|uniref:Uncharacterized protein n=1 Tax=Phyllosticta citrichinensis TaxID=1130410 RepID=A0ABR1XUU2_9PEZI
MNPSRLVRPQLTAIRQLCGVALKQPVGARQAPSFATLSTACFGRNPQIHRTCLSARHASTKSERVQEPKTVARTVENDPILAGLYAPTAVDNVEKKIKQILAQKDTVPSEDVLVPIMREADKLSALLVKSGTAEKESTPKQGAPDAASLLSDLDNAPPSARHPVDKLSSLVHQLMLHPPVFINPEMLELYVKIQSRLRQPEKILDVFDLYANKPIPKPHSSPVQYKQLKPDRILAAIPTHIANQAVDAALANKDLFLAMEMVENTFRTRSFNKAKLVRKVTVPLLGVGCLPIGLYYLAQMYAEAQTSEEHFSAALKVYAGGAAYLVSVVGLGFVAISTWNDQMKRVTWARGTPLSVRYMREEERAAIDKIAQAVGFREKSRWGEEEGEEWEAFVEWAAMRWMVVDAVELQEEMNPGS